jgi:queuine tRNA-ribosyltransferase
VEGVKMGYCIFDCVLPTRDGRHGRIYLLDKNVDEMNISNAENVYTHLFIRREKYVRDNSPIDESCDCHTCRFYSRAYLNHLFKIEDNLAGRLATIHNLRTYTRLMGLIRENLGR